MKYIVSKGLGHEPCPTCGKPMSASMSRRIECQRGKHKVTREQVDKAMRTLAKAMSGGGDQWKEYYMADILSALGGNSGMLGTNIR